MEEPEQARHSRWQEVAIATETTLLVLSCPHILEGDQVKDGNVAAEPSDQGQWPFMVGRSDGCHLIIETHVLLGKEEASHRPWPQHAATRKADEGSDLGLKPLSVASSRRSTSGHVLMELLKFYQHL